MLRQVKFKHPYISRFRILLSEITNTHNESTYHTNQTNYHIQGSIPMSRPTISPRGQPAVPPLISPMNPLAGTNGHIPPAITLMSLPGPAIAALEAALVQDQDEFDGWLQRMLPPRSQPIDIPVREEVRRGRRTRRVYSERLLEMERRRRDSEYTEVE